MISAWFQLGQEMCQNLNITDIQSYVWEAVASREQALILCSVVSWKYRFFSFTKTSNWFPKCLRIPVSFFPKRYQSWRILKSQSCLLPPPLLNVITYDGWIPIAKSSLLMAAPTPTSTNTRKQKVCKPNEKTENKNRIEATKKVDISHKTWLCDSFSAKTKPCGEFRRKIFQEIFVASSPPQIQAAMRADRGVFGEGRLTAPI